MVALSQLAVIHVIFSCCCVKCVNVTKWISQHQHHIVHVQLYNLLGFVKGSLKLVLAAHTSAPTKVALSQVSVIDVIFTCEICWGQLYCYQLYQHHHHIVDVWLYSLFILMGQGVGAVCVSIWKSWELRAISHLTLYSNSHCLWSARMSGDWCVYVQLCISNEIWDHGWPSVLGNDFNNGDFEGKQYSKLCSKWYLIWGMFSNFNHL